MTITVARLRPDDWERQRDLRLAALADSPEAFGSTLAREQAFEEDEWRHRAARPAGFIATRDDTDVGIAGVYDLEDGWCVTGMWLPRSARGTGVVDALLSACEAHARWAGATTLALSVMEDNPRGLAAYVRHGFVPTGGREHVRDGRDQLLMAKQLRPDG